MVRANLVGIDRPASCTLSASGNWRIPQRSLASRERECPHRLDSPWLDSITWPSKYGVCLVITAVLTFRGENWFQRRTAHSYSITRAPRKLYFTKYLCYSRVSTTPGRVVSMKWVGAQYTQADKWTDNEGQREKERDFYQHLEQLCAQNFTGKLSFPPPLSFYFPLLNSSPWNKCVTFGWIYIYMQLSCMTFFSLLSFFLFAVIVL